MLQYHRAVGYEKFVILGNRICVTSSGAEEGEDEMEITDTQLALLSVVPDSTGSISFSPENISIVIEDEVVMSELPSVQDMMEHLTQMPLSQPLVW
ncbi:uncharacterized protein AKAME5_001389700 [Lates japonicus]|uniref:Uncharacterized protein n=1 Tax=Lates japonicus TaxID=270547 RepID=A0AAD3RAS2_LATJO|nr:uncharacterized protein AKAME5_001389700 [Lates japonicus]